MEYLYLLSGNNVRVISDLDDDYSDASGNDDENYEIPASTSLTVERESDNGNYL